MHLLFFASDDDDNAATLRGWSALLVLVVLAGLVGILSRTIFFVDETQYVYVTQFGKPVQLLTEPGLAVKWPYQSLWRFDRRLQIYEPPGRELLTEDKENLIVQWFVVWRLASGNTVNGPASSPDSATSAGADQLRRQTRMYVERFLQTLGRPEAAESRLEERIQAAIAAEIGRTRFADLCTLDPNQTRLDAIAQSVTEQIRSAALDQFGLEVVDVRLKRFNYPEAVKPAVYAEIRSERQRIAVQYRAEGASEKERVESLADLQREQLLAEARREATTVRGRADAKAIEIYNAAHRQDPQFYEFLKTLETYRAILDEQTTVVLSADSPLLKLLQEGLPPLAPNNVADPTPPAVPLRTTPTTADKSAGEGSGITTEGDE